MTRPAPVFTVAREGTRGSSFLAHRYVLTIDQLPGRSWTYDYREMRDELTVSALLSPAGARNMLLDAFLRGSATIAGNR